MKTYRFMLLTALFALPLLMAQPVGAASGDAVHRTPSPPGATVGFRNLKDGDVVPPTFTVQFDVHGMDVVPAGTQQPDSGHHHLLVDVADMPDPNLPLPKTEHVIHFGGGQTEAELTLPEGRHTLQLVFADYAHIPHDPVVKSDRITITVAADAAGQQSD